MKNLLPISLSHTEATRLAGFLNVLFKLVYAYIAYKCVGVRLCIFKNLLGDFFKNLKRRPKMLTYKNGYCLINVHALKSAFIYH